MQVLPGFRGVRYSGTVIEINILDSGEIESSDSDERQVRDQIKLDEHTPLVQ